MNTYFCSDCVTCWAPYMALNDGCPECGSGLRRTHEPMSPHAEVRFKAAMRKLRASDDAERERFAGDGWLELEALFQAPAFEDEPEQHGEAA